MKNMDVVIDANLARSAGQTVHPLSSTARQLLINIYEQRHHILFCRKLSHEWRTHSSLFSKKWLATMIAKKRYKFVESLNQTELVLESLSISPQLEKLKYEALKDAHLIDLALCGDKIIFSNEVVARKAFCELLENEPHIMSIYWFSPVRDLEIIVEYILKNKQLDKSQIDKYLLKSKNY